VLQPRESDGQESRKALRVAVEVPGFGAVDVLVTHVTFVDMEQCNSFVQLLDAMNKAPAGSPQILLGDLNVYFDFEWPVELLTRRLDSFSISPHNPCRQRFQEILEKEPSVAASSGSFSDAWKVFHTPSDSSGNTFTNFYDHRLEDPSRPDRILFRSSRDSRALITVCETQIFGEESFDYGDTKMFISDHRGLLTRFALTKAP